MKCRDLECTQTGKHLLKLRCLTALFSCEGEDRFRRRRCPKARACLGYCLAEKHVNALKV